MGSFVMVTNFFSIGGGILNEYQIWSFYGLFGGSNRFFEVGGGRFE